MIKSLLVCAALAVSTVTSLAQSAAAMTRVAPTAPSEGGASAPMGHKWAKKLKSHKPVKPAVDPEAMTFKKGGA
jgi:hypothetical protein